jgi:hypothetical protein
MSGEDRAGFNSRTEIARTDRDRAETRNLESDWRKLDKEHRLLPGAPTRAFREEGGGSCGFGESG